MHRAYSLFHIKRVDDTDERREITGVATTPEPDRHGDVIDPLGVEFTNPVPLLFHHDVRAPIGHATFKKPTKSGVDFHATVARMDEPGPLKDRLDEAWASIKAGLLTGVSIGFRAFDDGMEFIKGGGIRFTHTEVVELSVVTIPANAAATIATVKSLDTAAIGPNPPGATGTPAIVRAKGTPRMATLTEQITSFETTRAAKDTARTALMNNAATKGETLDAAQTDEYDGLTAEITSIDAHLVRLRALEVSNRAAAAPVVPNAAPVITKAGAAPVVTVKANVEPGTAFVRMVQAIASTNGNRWEAAEYAKRWKDTTPEVELVLRAAVAAGTTTDATWAGPLAPMQPLAAEFLALLRPATILGKIPGFRTVPFNVSVPMQTGGGTYQWVGQGAPKPVGKLTFGTTVLGITKAAGIIVITEELARTSSPSAEATIRADMIAGIAQFLDVQFIDPAAAAVAGVSPGSITNGVTPITSTGTTPANARTDMIALMNALTAANIPVAGSVVVMSEANALALSASLNALGQPLFPGVDITGGTAMGVKVITSQVAGNNVVLFNPGCVLLADDGGVTIDVSREASLQMDSAPMGTPDATVVMQSLWQLNLIGLRAERFIHWKKARTGCVAYTVQAYAG